MRPIFTRWLSHTHIHTRGRWAERLVLLTYLLRGYRPLPRPAYAKVQIDLLLRRRHTIVLVEVKYRRHAIYRPLALHPQQHQRLLLAARSLAALHPSATVTLHLATVAPVWPFITRHILGPI